MIARRADAFSFLNRLATASTPFVGFIVGPWGFSLFTGSISHLGSDHFMINQSGDVPMPIRINVAENVTFQYGDVRELTSRLPPEMLAEEPFKTQIEYLRSLIPGALVLEFSGRTEAVGLIEIDVERLTEIRS